MRFVSHTFTYFKVFFCCFVSLRVSVWGKTNCKRPKDTTMACPIHSVGWSCGCGKRKHKRNGSADAEHASTMKFAHIVFHKLCINYTNWKALSTKWELNLCLSLRTVHILYYAKRLVRGVVVSPSNAVTLCVDNGSLWVCACVCAIFFVS